MMPNRVNCLPNHISLCPGIYYCVLVLCLEVLMIPNSVDDYAK